MRVVVAEDSTLLREGLSRLPPTHTDEGLRAALAIRERHPGTGVLVLSQLLAVLRYLRA